MVRILHIVSSINVGNGVMSVIMEYYRNININNIQFDFVYFRKKALKNYETEIKNLGGSCFCVAAPDKNLIKFEADIHRLYIKCKGRYHALHVHDIFMPAFLMDCKRQLKVKKVILHAHVPVYGFTFVKSARNRILSIPKYFIADEYWACSKAAGDALFGEKSFKKKGRILNNAIRLEQFSYHEKTREDLRKKLDLEDSFVIGHVGRFCVQKNHIFLLNIFEEVSKKKKNAKLVLVGDGDGRIKIEKLCAEKGLLNKVLFLGVRNNVEDWMNIFDVFVFPSICEGLGIALIEAQSIGIPCVYSEGIPDEANVLKKQNVILSLEDDILKWRDAILKAGREYDDPQEQLRTAGFDIKLESKKIVEYYRRG